MRKAKMKKNKSFKFGLSIGKGELVLIREELIRNGQYVFTAFRPNNDTLGFGVTASEFEYTDKEKFVVTRSSFSSRNIEVEATDRKEAKLLAAEEAGNFEFTEHDVEYSSDSVFTEQEHKTLFK